MLLGNILRRNAKLYPDKTAIIYEEKKYNYSELELRVKKLANGLLLNGVKKGDRVGVLGHPSPQYIELYIAIPKIGAILTPLNCRLSARELKYIINDAEIKMLVMEEEFTDLISSIRSDLISVKSFFCVEHKTSDTKAYEDLITGSLPEVKDPEIEDDDIAVLMYTSGTTGNPKGAMLTHKNLLSLYMSRFVDLKFGPDDIYLSSVPFYHTAAEYALIILYIGGTLVIHSSFEPERFLHDIKSEKITFTLGVPAMINFLVQHMEKYPKEYDFSTVKLFLYGASPMPVALLKKAMKAFNCGFLHSYGLTEACPGVCLLKPEEHILQGPPEKVKRLASCGKEIFNVEARVVNQQNIDVRPEEVGEIIVKGDNVMKGYWKLPDETEKALKNGWLYTGDMATVDDEGYIFIVDRKKDMIISGGENIYPREVEEVLYEHPDILEATVIGVPDEAWGETVKAFVVVKEGKNLSEREAIDFCKKNMASYKKPASVEFMKELPRNPLGKVLKKELRKKYWGNHDRKV